MSLVEKEIKEQVEILPLTLEYVENYLAKEKIPSFILENDLIYFIGCGTSLYLSLSASRFFTLKTGKETKFLPGGEIYFAYHENIGNKSLKRSAILISRSGESTEVIRAGKVFRKMNIPTLGITLEPESSLTKISDVSIVLPFREDSIVMTKSFSGILLSLELIASYMMGEGFNTYRKLVQKTPEIIQKMEEIAEENLNFKHYVFLGLGVEEGIARESALKLEEMSLSKVEAYSTFEYRHGPKSLVEEGFLVSLFRRGLKEEEDLIQELESYGAKVITIGDNGDHIPVSYLPESIFLKVLWGQILGLKIAYYKNINVESPRNLSKVVKF
uniref:SIS domain-containing protein n=1 Tax=Dictyoglomus thermophilum TaxID=14 RepID=A0A7C3MK42_DICTH